MELIYACQAHKDASEVDYMIINRLNKFFQRSLYSKRNLRCE